MSLDRSGTIFRASASDLGLGNVVMMLGLPRSKSQKKLTPGSNWIFAGPDASAKNRQPAFSSNLLILIRAAASFMRLMEFELGNVAAAFNVLVFREGPDAGGDLGIGEELAGQGVGA